MAKYRLLLLLKSGIKKEDKTKLLASIKKWIGEVKNDKIEELGEKKLSYPVKKEKIADYVLMHFDADKLSADLNKKLLIEEAILRHLLIRD